MEDPAALEMAVSRVLDSLPEEHHKSACLVSNYAAAAFRGTGSVSSVTPYEDITDCIRSQGNQARGKNPWVSGLWFERLTPLLPQ
jgi:hypothetical protein